MMRFIRSAAWLLILLTILGCGSSDVPMISVLVSGLSSNIISTTVKTTLNGKESQNQLEPLRQGFDRFDLRLQADAVGTVGITVTGQGPDGCTTLSGQTQVEVEGAGVYSAEVAVTTALGCQLMVRKRGDGSGNAELSDGTLFQFDVPDPPALMCPVESLQSTSQQKGFALGTEVVVRALIPTDAAPGSYISKVRGCDDEMGGCRVRIGADTRIVEIEIPRNIACSPAQVCWEHPLPQGASLYRIAGQDSSDIWTVGDGTLLHWEGSYWAPPRHPQISQQLRGIVTGPNNSMVAVGESGTVLRLIDNVWSCVESLGSFRLNDAWGVTPQDFWTVGSQGTVLHFDGRSWQSVTVPGLGNVELWRVYGRNNNDIWAVGELGTLLHYDGSSWNRIPFPNTETLYGLWESPNGEVWVVGDRGTSALVQGDKVKLLFTGTQSRLRAVYSVSELERWAVGDGGTLLRHDGKAWSVAESGTRQDLLSVWGGRSTDLWAVGTGGTLLHYNGAFWTLSSASRTTQALYGVGGAASSQSGSSDVLFAVGEQGTVLRNTGTDWVSDPVLGSVLARNLRAITAVSSSEIWIVGDNGTVIRWDGTQMQVPPSGTTADLNAVWAIPGNVLAVGSGGVLARFAGSSWVSTVLPAAAGRTLRTVWGSSAISVWIAGDGGTVLRWNGVSATAMSIATSEAVMGIWGSSASDVWAVGDRGHVFHYDGSTWSIHGQGSSLSSQSLRAITGTSAKNILIAGDGGTLLRYNGTTWSIVDSGTSSNLTSLWATPMGQVILSGHSATILRYQP